MFVIIGLAVVFGSIIAGFVMEGGKIPALIQIAELVIIGGAAFGSVLVANPMSAVMATFKAVLGLLKPNPYNKTNYMELLRMLYDMFMMARREGLVTLDQHVEKPHDSKFFANYPFFFGNHHALSFLADTMKVIITGSVADHNLAEMMDVDLEVSHEEMNRSVTIISKVGDAMPGFGIVAAVLGVVITMGAIGGPPEQIGHKVGAALVGTFLGILMAYGIFAPLAAALEGQIKAEGQYMGCIKNALLSFARGDAPLTAVEFARRNIEPSARPSFAEMEQTLKNVGGGASGEAQAKAA
ncbi:MAG TPA: flagellar motor stator protein MotA [Chthonomonadaceae bacterium]|nr:flagellar motor stator protein MotA [Chthonomonadaceae bacterium]